METSQFHFELAHVGINQENAEEAKETANMLFALFGFAPHEFEESIFLDDAFEIMKKPYLGRLGHVAIRTDTIEDAIEYLKSRGIAFDDQSAVLDEEGNVKVIYFAKDIAGFRFHLTSRG